MKIKRGPPAVGVRDLRGGRGALARRPSAAEGFWNTKVTHGEGLGFSLGYGDVVGLGFSLGYGRV